jgi:beta-barrel assembly-enhancing protease
MRSSATALLLALLLTSGVAAGESQNLAGTGLPPYVQAYEPTTVDERGLWMEADESERVVRDSALLLNDAALNKYVKGVFCTAVGDDRCKSVRIYILEVPQFNASMSANGTMRIWSGLLLRVQNEAELAAVLGHEFAHFELRHSLSGFKQARNSSDIGAWLSVLGGFTNTNTSNAQVAILGTYYRFSRQQETDADLLSLKFLRTSSYPTAAASSVWTYIMSENDARAVGRGLKPKKNYSAGFFATHPSELNRATYLKLEAEKMGSSGDLRAKEYRDALRPLLPRLLAAQVRSNDFGGSEYLLQTIAGVEGWSGDLLFARGSLYRQRANPRDLNTAVELFNQAIAKGYSNPVVHRELGLSLLRNGSEIEGKAALQKYLTLEPEASDKTVIQMLAGN